ncbi:MAG TPA: succinate dehydrogenase, cytochrome b556 subunit [Thermoleophilia bacterium]|nr:succinate dehydrogenase, cytochrome b556 subunit [Thermoleophilia bacterium]
MIAEKTRRTENVGAGNWKGWGMWAWILHRVSGLALVLYLFMHISVIAASSRGGADENIFETFEQDIFVTLDLLLTAAVVFHGLNGLRILLFDLGIGTYRHKSLFYGVMAATAVVLAVFAYASFYYISNGEGPW